MVYAMFIVFLLFHYIHAIHCQTTTTTTTAPNVIYNCSFLNNTYLTNAAVSNQFQFFNQTSISLIANYAFLSSPLSISTFEIGLIYPFFTSTYLVPFPVIFDCSSTVSSCQLQTVPGSTAIARDSEPIRAPLTSFNYTSNSIQFNQMGLYLIQGRYQLSNCTFDNGKYITDPNTIFDIQIQYEKPVGTFCDPSVNTCGSSSLTTCSSSSFTCTCLSSNSLVSYSNSFYCADTMNTSNCTIFPTRCISWCNSTTNNLCICPSDTLKIQRNNFYVCELPVNSLNCSIYDEIRRCPLGQSCTNGQCLDNIVIITTTTMKINDSIDPTDQRLRIALGVIAGLLGTSVLILLGVFCWFRYRQKRRRMIADKPSSPSSSSSTSSLYISPIQQQDQNHRKFSSTNQIYQLPIQNNKQIFSPIYRTDSFRQAVHSGHNRTNQTIEHVSTHRDSFIGRTFHQNEDFETPTYNTIEFINPPQLTNNHNVYQVIVPSSSPTILTHRV